MIYSTGKYFSFNFLLFCFCTLCASAQDNCDLVKDSDGIKVFTCKSDSSKFRSLSAEFVLEDTSLETLDSLIWDVGKYVNWQYNTVSSALIKKLNDHEMIYRTEIHAPWPVQNREMVVQLSVYKSLDPNELFFSINSVSYNYPVNENLTRIPFLHALWRVTKINNSLHVKYTLDVNPGGYIPAVLVNLAMAEGPYESFYNLKKLIEK